MYQEYNDIKNSRADTFCPCNAKEENMSKKLYFGSNLKMYKTIKDTVDYLNALVDNTKDISRDEIELFIIPSYTTLESATRKVDRKYVKLGAQNMCWEDEGQFTGEISPVMLKELGLDLVMIGHSERRHVFGETDIEENKKVKEYFLLYQNNVDLSNEVIKLDQEGLFKKKIKKISNEYYFIKDFLMRDNTLYFIGYITCLEDYNCNYDTHSLLLISDEDKVIEVKNNTARNMFFIFLGIIIFITVFIIFKRKRLNT